MRDCDVVKMSKCFWCNGEKDELILLGNKATRKEQNEWCDNKSMSVIVSYEPCEKCKEEFDKGIQLIEAQDDPVTPKQPEISEGVYPTGRFWVIKREAFTDDIPEEQTFMFIKEETAKEMGLYEAESV